MNTIVLTFKSQRARAWPAWVVSLAICCAPFAAQAEPPDDPAGSPRFVSGRLLVKFKDGIMPNGHAESAALQASQTSVIGRMSELGVTIVRTPMNAREMDHLNALKLRPEVEYAELDLIHDPASVPNDPSYQTQWHLPQINAPAAWDVSTGSSAVIIAILDSGVNGSHPDLASKVVPGRNVYDNNSNTNDVTGHGTVVAGVAAAISNNALGCASPAWACRIMPMRISSPNGGASTTHMASALLWAADHGARVANLSYCLSGYSPTLSNAAQYFQNQGGVVVTSAGNNGDFVSTLPDDPYLLLVSATNETDTLAAWSSTGSNVDLSAPGQNILSTLKSGGYGNASGTSVSAPLVSGVAALMFSINPNLTGEQARDLIKQAVDDLGPPGWDPGYGHGRLNALKAVQLASGDPSQSPPGQSPPSGGGGGGGSGDTSAPTVFVASPTSGSWLGNNVNISADASDDVGVVRVEFFIDGLLKGTDSNSPYTYKWNTRSAANGPHSITVKAFDAAGNVGTSASITVYK